MTGGLTGEGGPSQPYRVGSPGPGGTAATDGRAALLVIHGIGEQKPYEALGAFGQGLAAHLRIQAEQLSHHLLWREGKAHSVVRLPLPAGTPVRELDLHELHWAPLVQGRVKIRQVLAWIVRTSLTPLRSISQQWEVLSLEPGAADRQWWVALREILRALLLVAVALVVMAPFVIAVLKREAILPALGEVARILGRVEHPLALIAWIVLVGCGATLLVAWVRGRRGGPTAPNIEAVTERRWRAWALWWTAVLAAVAGVIQVVAPVPVGRLVRDVGAALWGWPLTALASAGLAWLLMRPLVKYLGDVTLYVNADENSSAFRTRADILKASTARLRMLLADEGYRVVYVAGHSLGSVIAYDTINHLIRDVVAEPPDDKLTAAQLERLGGLLTFGSPLDKVNYFFRVIVDRDEAIRAQLTSRLHGFRKRSSRRAYGHLAFRPDAFTGLPRFRWLNVYSHADFVSGRLDYYEPDRQEHLLYLNPLTAHLAYWDDPRFYAAAIGQWLFADVAPALTGPTGTRPASSPST